MGHGPAGVLDGVLWTFGGAVLGKGNSASGLSDIAVAIDNRLGVGILDHFSSQIHLNDALRDRYGQSDADQQNMEPAQWKRLAYGYDAGKYPTEKS
jgi:hypothetical protein